MMTRLRFLTRHEVDPFWPRLAELFQVAVDRSVHGEYRVDDLYEGAMKGNTLIAFIEDNQDEILMVLAMSLLYYPKMKILNVVAMAGRDMDHLFAEHHGEIAEFAKSTGAVCFEATCSRAISRMLQKNNWYHRYEVCRFDL